jgi:hypothetical protein
MTVSFTSVRPGDVISSDLMNYVLTKLAEFDARLSKLEAGSVSGNVQIASFDPPLQQNAGRPLTIYGSNFAVPASVNLVMLGNYQITSFTSPNSATVLNFTIPNDFVPPADGNVSVTISNSQGKTTALYKVLPFVQVTGPDPVIQNVLPIYPTTVILVKNPIHIVGANFAPTGSDNQIIFDVVTSLGVDHYPQAGSQLVFDNAHSDSNNIIVTLPDISEISTPGPAGQREVTLRLTVGAHPEQRFPFTARRS